MIRHRSLVLIVCATALMACQPYFVSFQSRGAFLVQFASTMNQRVEAVAGPNRSPSHWCLPDPYDGLCRLVRGGRHQYRCAFYGCHNDRLVIEMRTALLANPDVLAIVERESARYCSYRDPREPNSATLVQHSLGCSAPYPGLERYYEIRPTVCVLTIGAGTDLAIEGAFAVRDGARVVDSECKEFSRRSKI